MRTSDSKKTLARLAEGAELAGQARYCLNKLRGLLEEIEPGLVVLDLLALTTYCEEAMEQLSARMEETTRQLEVYMNGVELYGPPSMLAGDDGPEIF